MADAPLVVAIDGPSGVGKSTVAQQVAGRLGIPYLDTGAMYRAVGLYALRHSVDPSDEESVEPLLETIQLELRTSAEGEHEVWLDGIAVGEEIRSPRVDVAASKVAAHPVVRRKLVELQRESAHRTGGVLEGRDIGTKVVPSTPHKFFLDAEPPVRTRRRYEQLLARGRATSFEEVAAEIAERDERDTQRSDSPLRCDDSYQLLDASDASVEEVVEEIVRRVQLGRTAAMP